LDVAVIDSACVDGVVAMVAIVYGTKDETRIIALLSACEYDRLSNMCRFLCFNKGYAVDEVTLKVEIKRWWGGFL
jgi:hypothetical protein